MFLCFSTSLSVFPPYIVCLISVFQQFNVSGTVLHVAAMHGDVDVISHILEDMGEWQFLRGT